MTEKMIATNFTLVASMKAEELAKQRGISLDTAQMMIARAKALVLNHELQTHKEKLKALLADGNERKLSAEKMKNIKG
jgi:hypothetical protein